MIELRTLGVLDLRDADGAEVRSVLQQPKRLALLVFLALASPRRYHRRDSLLAMFWPDLDEDHARAALRRSLHFLRSALGAEVIEARGEEELRVSPEQLWCDALAFDDLLRAGDEARALDLYGGDLLAGFHVAGAPQVQDWLDRERVKLRDGAIRGAWALAEAAESSQCGADAGRWGQRAFELAPDDEDALRRLLRLLDRTGDRTRALNAYREFGRRRALEQEPAPAAVTQALFEEIRARPERPGEPGVVQASPLAPARSSDSSETSTVLEREGVVETPPAANAPPRRRLRFALAAAVLAGLIGTASIALSHRKSDLDPRRIVVTMFENRTGNDSLDALGLIATDWISRGLSETRLVEVLDPSVALALGPPAGARDSAADPVGQARWLAARTKAGTLVVGSYYGQGDSLYFEAKIVDAAGNRLLAALPPIGELASRPLAAIDALRQRVMGALAVRLDPRLRDVPSASEPPTYEAYRRYVEGFSLHMRGDFRGAIRELTLAAAGDSGFRTPLIIAGAGHYFLAEYATADSLVRLVSRNEEQLTPVEAYTLQWLQAMLAGDKMRALEMSRETGRLAPGTAMELSSAIDAVWVNRPHEALTALTAIDPDQGILRESGILYWWALSTAYHVLGEHRRELRAAEAARTRYGANWDTLFLELRALAALGQLTDVGLRLQEIPGLGPGRFWSPENVLTLIGKELRAHGHADAARETFERAVAWSEAHAPGDANRESRSGLAHTLYLAGNWEAAHRLAAELAAQDTTDWYPQALLAMLAARRGDAAEAERLAERLGAGHRPYLFGSVTNARARIAALLGKREEAVALLRQASAEGYLFVHEIHIDPDLETLRSYPPFTELLRPKG